MVLHGIKFTACTVVCTVCMTATRIVADDDGGPMIIKLYLTMLALSALKLVFKINGREKLHCYLE